MEFKDYYATLGVTKSASPDEIKRAYRKLARAHHPDLNPGDLAAERRFKEINEAQEVLGDPEKRRKYDELGANWRMYEQAGPGASPFGAGGRSSARWSTSGAGGFRGMSPEEAEDLFGGASPFSDFFQTFFTGGAPGHGPRRPVSRRGRDLEHPVTLSLEEAYDGTVRRLTFESAGNRRPVDVKIPPGVGDGARVRVAGEGEPGSGAAAGDLFLRVHVTPHATFTRRGQDLFVDVTVPVTTAVLGGQVSVPRLRGTPLALKVPASTQSGQVFRLTGHGMPALGSAKTIGDLYATVAVRLPERLSAAQRRHYEALAALETEPAPAATKGA